MSGDVRRLIEVALLDDDRDFRDYIADSLHDDGFYSVHGFAHPDDLFDYWQNAAPDIVLLDMKMGQHSGDKVLESLLARWQNLCVIVVTGYPSLESMRTVFKMKVFDYLAKPFSLSQLRAVLLSAADTYGFGRGDPERLRHRLGHRVRVLRIERDWSLKDLADKTNLSASQISSIERGAHLPSIESLLAIARAFHLRPSELLATIGF